MSSNEDKIIEATRFMAAFCESVGVNISDSDTQDTPRRVAKMFVEEFTQGLRDKTFTFTTFPVKEGQADQLVIECGIKYSSLCAHHLLPFTGQVHLCYLPREKLAGLSKLVRAVKWITKKPSVQESLIGDIVDVLKEELDPYFIGVSMSGVHQCMSCRGVEETNAVTINNKFYSRGPSALEDKKDYLPAREEFMQAINHFYQMKGHL